MILAIDPGTTRSAWLLLGTDGRPRLFDLEPNEVVRDLCRLPPEPIDRVAIEMVASYGMPVGREVFETVRWIGRFQEAAIASNQPSVELVYRADVKWHLCQSQRANDASIRQALIDRFGGSSAVGTKKSPGPLYGISKDVWSALAVAVTAHDSAICKTKENIP